MQHASFVETRKELVERHKQISYLKIKLNPQEDFGTILSIKFKSHYRAYRKSERASKQNEQASTICKVFLLSVICRCKECWLQIRNSAEHCYGDMLFHSGSQLAQEAHVR